MPQEQSVRHNAARMPKYTRKNTIIIWRRQHHEEARASFLDARRSRATHVDDAGRCYYFRRQVSLALTLSRRRALALVLSPETAGNANAGICHTDYLFHGS